LKRVWYGRRCPRAGFKKKGSLKNKRFGKTECPGEKRRTSLLSAKWEAGNVAFGLGLKVDGGDTSTKIRPTLIWKKKEENKGRGVGSVWALGESWETQTGSRKRRFKNGNFDTSRKALTILAVEGKFFLF